jgi:hypothetical protein
MAENLKTGGSRDSGSTSIDLPGRKLATSKKPRMLTPSEIELLRQDLKSALKVLGQDEIDDAHELLRRCGFRAGDFEILQRSDPSPPHVSPLSGTATVVRKSNRFARTYEAGHLSSWLLQLEEDLKAGHFGRP